MFAVVLGAASAVESLLPAGAFGAPAGVLASFGALAAAFLPDPGPAGLPPVPPVPPVPPGRAFVPGAATGSSAGLPPGRAVAPAARRPWASALRVKASSAFAARRYVAAVGLAPGTASSLGSWGAVASTASLRRPSRALARPVSAAA